MCRRGRRGARGEAQARAGRPGLVAPQTERPGAGIWGILVEGAEHLSGVFEGKNPDVLRVSLTGLVPAVSP